MSAELEIIDQNAILRLGTDADKQALADASRLDVLEADTMLLTEGTPASHVYALDTGSVSVFHTAPDGKEVVVKLFGGPCFFGEAEAFAQINWLVSARVVSRATVLSMPTRAMLRFLRRNAECAARMVIDVGIRLAVASYHERSLAFDPSTVRLANYLLDFGSWTNPANAREWQIDLTQEDMAAAIGVTRRSVAKDIAMWKDAGLIRRQEALYVISDVEAFQGYGDPQRMSLSYRLSEQVEKLLEESS